MRELSGAIRSDNDAAVLYAESLMDLNPWKLLGGDGTPAEGTLELVAVLERVLARAPDHTGANHYYIHAVEASPHPEKALRGGKAAGNTRAVGRPPGPHAGAHLHPHRQLPRRQRVPSRGRQARRRTPGGHRRRCDSLLLDRRTTATTCTSSRSAIHSPAIRATRSRPPTSSTKSRPRRSSRNTAGGWLSV